MTRTKNKKRPFGRFLLATKIYCDIIICVWRVAALGLSTHQKASVMTKKIANPILGWGVSNILNKARNPF